MKTLALVNNKGGVGKTTQEVFSDCERAPDPCVENALLTPGENVLSYRTVCDAER